jgi:hypothetical protein
MNTPPMTVKYLIGFILLVFFQLAKGQCFLVPSQVCLGECGPVFYLQNDPDGTTYQWSIDCGTITNDMAANPHTVCFNSSGICTIQVIIQIPGEDPDTCSMEVEVLSPSLTVINEDVCEGDSIEINGTYYLPGFYTDTVFGGAVNGCDSILLITVNSIPVSMTLESYMGCAGDGYSVTVNGVVYDETNPSGTEILTNVSGCDSIVTIELIFLPAATSHVIYFGCEGDGYSVEVNGIIYDESNPTGVDTIVAANGCDSIITINLTYFPMVQQTISYSGCSGDGYSVQVGGNIYDESNPTGIDTLIGGCDTIVTIDLHFDTLNAFLTLEGNQLCASPPGLEYTWITCDSIELEDTTECITLSGAGCICVIVTNGACTDTICQEYLICELTCEVIAPEGICLGDSVLLTLNTNASDSAIIDWTITLDTFAGVNHPDTDSIWTVFNTPGCYSMDVMIEDQGCITTCTDTVCVIEKPIADLCCDVVQCDSCVTLTVFLFGNGPLTIAISDGTNTDTISGIHSSQYDHVVCPPYNTSKIYSLLWVRDSLGYCEGGLVNDSVTVHLEEQPYASITISGDTLCAGPGTSSYEWWDCEMTSNLSSNQCFVPGVSGCYCLSVSTLLSDCIDTACVNFIISNTGDIAENEMLVWYGGENSIILQSTDIIPEHTDIRLFDVQGKTIAYRSTERIGDQFIKIQLNESCPTLVLVSLINEKTRLTRPVFVPGF